TISPHSTPDSCSETQPHPSTDCPVRIHSFFFNDTATTEIYTLSLHDALPICACVCVFVCACVRVCQSWGVNVRSEEHTSELQSHLNLVCRLLLEKKTRPRARPHETCAIRLRSMCASGARSL